MGNRLTDVLGAVDAAEKEAAAEAKAYLDSLGGATPIQPPAARTKREWILLATKVLAVIAAIIPANLAYWGDAEGKANVADAKAETAYAVLRERVTYVDGQLAELRSDLADVRDLLKLLVAQREALAAGVRPALTAPPIDRPGQVGGRPAAMSVAPLPGTIGDDPDLEALSDAANIADLARMMDTEEPRGLKARAYEAPAAPLPSLDQAVQVRAKAQAAKRAD
jgi:hypothetical protein